MKKTPASLLSVVSMLLHVIAIPVFYLGFILVYQSQWINLFLNAGRQMLVFNALMLTCILIGVLCASRIPVTAVRKHLRFTWWQ